MIGISLFYDGQCFLCSSYQFLIRLRKSYRIFTFDYRHEDGVLNVCFESGMVIFLYEMDGDSCLIDRVRVLSGSRAFEFLSTAPISVGSLTALDRCRRAGLFYRVVYGIFIRLRGLIVRE